jgi:hypothetical protein
MCRELRVRAKVLRGRQSKGVKKGFLFLRFTRTRNWEVSYDKIAATDHLEPRR